MADTNCKEVILVAADFLALADKLASGFSFTEVFTLAPLALQAVKDLVDEVKNIKGLLPEYASLTDADRQDLEAYVAANVQFAANANVQKYVQKAFDLVITLSSIFGG